MQMTQKGIALIKRWEGLRLSAYKDPVGIWTIGYGHTAMAGPPAPASGMKITEKKATEILMKDLQKFIAGVDAAIKNPRTTNEQFSACVSLAFNIGVGAFKKSSVLRFLNAGRYNDAADAFMLWNKAGGRVLPGLTKRRAEEAAMFSSRPNETEAEEEIEERETPEEPTGKNPLTSTTNVATGIGAIAGVTGAGKQIASDTADIFSMANMGWILLILVIASAAGWVFFQRFKASRDWAI